MTKYIPVACITDQTPSLHGIEVSYRTLGNFQGNLRICLTHQNFNYMKIACSVLLSIIATRPSLKIFCEGDPSSKILFLDNFPIYGMWDQCEKIVLQYYIGLISPFCLTGCGLPQVQWLAEDGNEHVENLTCFIEFNLLTTVYWLVFGHVGHVKRHCNLVDITVTLLLKLLDHSPRIRVILKMSYFYCDIMVTMYLHGYNL